MLEKLLLRLQDQQTYLPFDLAVPENALFALFFLTFVIALRYIIAAGIFYLFFWKLSLFKGFKRVHSLKPAKGQVYHELMWSLISCFIFAAAALFMGLAWQRDLSLVYANLHRYDLIYFPLSFFTLSLIHEFYFYWTHVFMHKEKRLRKAHTFHHRSVRATPWASFSFHPWEALIHALFLPLATLILPLHPVTILAYLIFMTLTAISNHLGVELIDNPQLRKLFISATHHNQHHKNQNKNFGLYYTFSDRIFNTEEKHFE